MPTGFDTEYLPADDALLALAEQAERLLAERFATQENGNDR